MLGENANAACRKPASSITDLFWGGGGFLVEPASQKFYQSTFDITFVVVVEPYILIKLDGIKQQDYFIPISNYNFFSDLPLGLLHM